MDDADIKKMLTEIGTTFESFKKDVNEQIATVKKTGGKDPLLEEKIEKQNTRLTELETMKKNLEDINKALARTPTKIILDKNGKEMPEDWIETKSMQEAFIRKGEHSRDVGGGAEFTMLKKSLSVQSDPDGGYTVHADLGGQVVEFIRESSPVRQVASVQSISTDALEGTYDQGQAASGWVAEQEDRPETGTPQLGKWRIDVHEQYANPRATQKLLDDSSIAMEPWLAAKVADILSRTENTAFVLGNGVGKPKGFMTYAHGTAEANGTIEQVNSGAAATFTAEGLMNLIMTLKEPYRSRATFAVNRLGLLAIRKIKGAQNDHFMWQPSLQLGQPATLLSYPYVEMADIVAPTANGLCAMFADFKAMYQIVDRQGLRVLRDPYTAKPFVQFYTTKRVGGAVVNFQAGKIQKMSA